MAQFLVGTHVDNGFVDAYAADGSYDFSDSIWKDVETVEAESVEDAKASYKAAHGIVEAAPEVIIPATRSWAAN